MVPSSHARAGAALSGRQRRVSCPQAMQPIDAASNAAEEHG